MANKPVVHLRYEQGNPRTACGRLLSNTAHATQHPAIATCGLCKKANDAHPERAATYMPPPTRR